MWADVRFGVDDVSGLDATVSTRKNGLGSVFRNGYVWNVRRLPDGWIESWVESDHKMWVAYRVRVCVGMGKLEGFSCTCTTKRSLVCKHVVALLYAVAVLATNIVDHPKWLSNYPKFRQWPEGLEDPMYAKNFADVRSHFDCELPAKFVQMEGKQKKKGAVKKKTTDVDALSRKRPRDVRAVAPSTQKRVRRTPERYDD